MTGWRVMHCIDSASDLERVVVSSSRAFSAKARTPRLGFFPALHQTFSFSHMIKLRNMKYILLDSDPRLDCTHALSHRSAALGPSPQLHGRSCSIGERSFSFFASSALEPWR